MKRLVVLSGAGISAESGLKTFRDSGGLWEGYAIEEVATPEAFNRYPERVLRFYNERRRQLDSVKPNKAHELLAKLEKHFNTTIITQNVDDLHEQAGSAQVLHLHGELYGLAAQHSEKDGCIWEHKTYSLDNCMKTAVTCAQILYGLARLCP